ncbi:MAG: hypothetical protein J7M21_01450 [Planctomycetes bacterium]|nr:hypothetical protein [Planctomycetota bacterium]
MVRLAGQIDRLRLVAAKLASEYKAIPLETQDIFDTVARRVEPFHWMRDGVHPPPRETS